MKRFHRVDCQSRVKLTLLQNEKIMVERSHSILWVFAFSQRRKGGRDELSIIPCFQLRLQWWGTHHRIIYTWFCNAPAWHRYIMAFWSLLHENWLNQWTVEISISEVHAGKYLLKRVVGSYKTRILAMTGENLMKSSNDEAFWPVQDVRGTQSNFPQCLDICHILCAVYMGLWCLWTLWWPNILGQVKVSRNYLAYFDASSTLLPLILSFCV